MALSFEKIIEQISKDYTDAWNNEDLEKLGSFLHKNVVVKSPQISKLFPENIDSELQGKDQVKAYWKRLFNEIGCLKVEQVSLNKKGRTVTTINKVLSHNTTIVEEFILDEYGYILDLKYTYYLEGLQPKDV